jgi:predicted metal-dependent enzyme (double-stranded beta helix superfamily)
VSAGVFDQGTFIAACRAALSEAMSQQALREAMARAVSDTKAVFRALGEPGGAEMQTIHRSDDLTVLNVIWAPRMTIMPHDHRMVAVIGIYAGREDNIFWRRISGDPRGRIEAAGGKDLCQGDVAVLGRDIVHSVTNPMQQFTGAIHVYAGDFFATPRSEWNPETLTEQPYNVEKNVRLFDEANARLRAFTERDRR